MYSYFAALDEQIKFIKMNISVLSMIIFGQCGKCDSMWFRIICVIGGGKGRNAWNYCEKLT